MLISSKDYVAVLSKSLTCPLPLLSSLPSIDSLMIAESPYGGMSFTCGKKIGKNVQVKRFEARRSLGLTVTNNGLSILFI